MKLEVDWSAPYQGGNAGEGPIGGGVQREGGGPGGDGTGDGASNGASRQGGAGGAGAGEVDRESRSQEPGFVFDGPGTYGGDGSQYDECHRKQGPAEPKDGPAAGFKPTEETSRKLPRFDKNELGQVSVEFLGELAYMFFMIMFPPAVILLLVTKVRKRTVRCWRS